MNFQMICKKIGIIFTLDNHVTPIFRLGRFHRLANPGYVRFNPFIEQTLPAVSTGVRVTSLSLQNVLSQDGIPFGVRATALYRFTPSTASRQIVSQLVKANPDVLKNIFEDYASQGLRRLCSRHDAQRMTQSDVVSSIERDLSRFLSGQLKALGLETLKNGGILIQEIVAPEKYTRTMLFVNLHQETMGVLARFRELQLTEQAIKAEFLNGLVDQNSNLAFISPMFSDTMPILPHLQTEQKFRASANKFNGGS